MSNTIRLKGTGRYDEAVANAAISPGHLVEFISTGKIRVHSTEGGVALPVFALESPLEGGTVDDAFSASDIVPIVFANKGDMVNALCESGYDYAIGELLYSSGTGTLTNTPSTTTLQTNPVAICAEAASLNDSGDTDTLLAVYVL